jgi:hypothetical protein
MKSAARLLLVFVMASCGCVELPVPWRDNQPVPALPPAPVKPERPARPVTPAQVSEANAHAKADALDEEIARDEEAETTSAGSEHAPAENP